MSDQTPYRTDKYIVTRTDGLAIGRTFVIEIDKDPDAEALLAAIINIYQATRPALADSLQVILEDIGRRPVFPQNVCEFEHGECAFVWRGLDSLKCEECQRWLRSGDPGHIEVAKYYEDFLKYEKTKQVTE
jgi:hypothetical protein